MNRASVSREELASRPGPALCGQAAHRVWDARLPGAGCPSAAGRGCRPAGRQGRVPRSLCSPRRCGGSRGSGRAAGPRDRTGGASRRKRRHRRRPAAPRSGPRPRGRLRAGRAKTADLLGPRAGLRGDRRELTAWPWAPLTRLPFPGHWSHQIRRLCARRRARRTLEAGLSASQGSRSNIHPLPASPGRAPDPHLPMAAASALDGVCPSGQDGAESHGLPHPQSPGHLPRALAYPKVPLPPFSQGRTA